MLSAWPSHNPSAYTREAWQVYENLLERAHDYHQLGTINIQAGDYPTAPSFDKKALVIEKTALPMSILYWPLPTTTATFYLSI
jgi:hypothetical protein